MGHGYLSVNGGSMLNEEQLLDAIARSRLHFKYFYSVRGVCYLCVVKPIDVLISGTKLRTKIRLKQKLCPIGLWQIALCLEKRMNSLTCQRGMTELMR